MNTSKLGLRLLILFVTGLIYLFSSGCDPCINDKHYSAASPDNLKYVHIFRRNCGAMTQFTINISISESKSDPGGNVGNIFIGDWDDELQVVWKDNNSLDITLAGNTRVIKRELRHGNVTIDYKHSDKHVEAKKVPMRDIGDGWKVRDVKE